MVSNALFIKYKEYPYFIKGIGNFLMSDIVSTNNSFPNI